MYNDLYKHKKSDSIKWIIAFGLIVVLLCGMVSNFILDYSSSDPKKDESASETDKPAEGKDETASGNMTEQTLNASFIPTEIHEASVIKLMSAPMLTAEGDEGVKIDATVTSSTETDFFDHTLNWSIAFKNPVSTWAKGKTAADYVELTVSEDTQNATVVCKTAFGEPIVVKATSKDNPDCSATCQLDYVKRINNLEILGLNYDTEDSDPDLTYQDAVKFGNNEVDYRFDYGVGTLTPEVSLATVKLNLCQDLANNIKNYLPDSTQSWAFTVDAKTNSTDSNTGSAGFDVSINTFYIKDFQPGTGDTTALNNAFYYRLYNCYDGFDRNNGTSMDCSVKLTYTFNVNYEGNKYQSVETIGDGCHSGGWDEGFTYLLASDGLELISSVDSVAFNKNGIIF